MKRILGPSARALASAACVLFSSPYCRAQEGDPSISQHYQVVAPAIKKAAKDVEAHKFDQAKMELEPAIKLVPNHAQAHFLLAWMAYEEHDFAGALDNIETSERSLQGLRICFAKAKAEESANDAAEARDIQTSIDQLKSAINSSNEAETSGASDLLGTKEHHLRDLDSKKAFKGGAAFDVPAAYSFLHGNCLFRLGRPAEAAEQYRLAVRSNPTYGKAWNNLISMYLTVNNMSLAKTTLAQAEAAGVVIQPRLKQRVLEK